MRILATPFVALARNVQEPVPLFARLNVALPHICALGIRDSESCGLTVCCILYAVRSLVFFDVHRPLSTRSCQSIFVPRSRAKFFSFRPSICVSCLLTFTLMVLRGVLLCSQGYRLGGSGETIDRGCIWASTVCPKRPPVRWKPVVYTHKKGFACVHGRSRCPGFIFSIICPERKSHRLGFFRSSTCLP